tara:strand:- start:3904 stop:4242 length:339 start_codon:yes stop_codon:yes gene_type:complete
LSKAVLKEPFAQGGRGQAVGASLDEKPGVVALIQEHANGLFLRGGHWVFLVWVGAAGVLRCAFRSERVIARGRKKARDAGEACRAGKDEQAEAPRTKGNAVGAEIRGKKTAR